MPVPSSREVILAPRVPVGAVQPVQRFRSTWISGSLEAIRERGLLPQYQRALSRQDFEELTMTVAGTWFPTAIVVRHYRACDSLGLGADEMIAMGAQVTRRVHATALSWAVRVATDVGVTPWSIFSRLDKLWERVMDGGAVRVTKLGPKEAIIELFGFPLAPIGYIRFALRGVIFGLTSTFCARAWVHENREGFTATTLSYRVQWA